jgi:hypothetical protein
VIPAIMLMALPLCSAAQVLSPAEISDPAIGNLQKSYQTELHAIATALAPHQYPYHFYFSRKLDLTEREQQESDQRSIQFDRFRGQVVLKITGNYFAAYSADRMTKAERAKQTWQDVMLPILLAAVPALAKTDGPQAFALEISHHVIRKVLGVDNEAVENFVMILPKASAQRLTSARDEAGRESAAAEGTAYLNGVPISLWPGAARENPARETPALVSTTAGPASTAPPPAQVKHSDSPPAQLETRYRDSIAKMLKDLDPQAHFVVYAPPSFIPFRGGQYLQISLTTTLPANDAGSQYKLAALAFDRHVVHLIRPVLATFKDDGDFSGFDFSTSIHLTGADAETAGGEAVEFILPLSALRSYAAYDLTGQQLLDAGIVLVNGERVGVDLQSAEASGRLQN